jgi:hypothetical protein
MVAVIPPDDLTAAYSVWFKTQAGRLVSPQSISTFRDAAREDVDDGRVIVAAEFEQPIARIPDPKSLAT